MKYKIFYTILILFFDMVVYSQNFTLKNIASITDLYESHSEWFDMDNDGDLDLLIIGKDVSNNKKTLLLENNGSGGFTQLSHTMHSLVSGQIALNDYDNDGFIDVMLMGKRSSGATEIPSVNIYRNGGNKTFTEVFSGEIVDVYSGAILWDDLDNDFIPEVVVSGKNSANQTVVKSYKLVNGIYTEFSTTLMAMYSVSMVAVDLDGDALKEIVMSGYSSVSEKKAQLYKNKGGLVFEETTVSLFRRVVDGHICSGDIDNDGDQDLLFTGLDETNSPATEIYVNGGSYSFTSNTTLVSLKSSHSALFDINHDGWLDVVLCGDNGTAAETAYYLNNQNGSFTKSTYAFQNVKSGHVSVADYNNNGVNDILVTGLNGAQVYSNVYQSDVATSDSPPSMAEALTSVVDYQKVTLSWNQPTAVDETPSVALSYNLYLRNSNGTYLIRPLSKINSANSKLRKQKDGNVGYRKSIVLSGLAEDTYSWSVQTVDWSFNASVFATEKTFVACENFDISNDIKICMNSNHPFTIDGKYSVNKWFTVKNATTISTANVLDYKVTQQDTLICEFTINGLGCTQKDSVKLDTLTLPEFTFGPDESVCLKDVKALNISSVFTNADWYSQSGGALAESSATLNHTVIQNEKIWSVVKSSNNCLYSDTIVLSALSLPSFTLGSDQSICENSLANLQVTGSFAQANWSDMNNLSLKSNSFTFTPTVVRDSVVKVRVEGVNGCFANDTIKLQKLALPQYTLGNDTSVCYQQSIALKVSNTYSSAKWHKSGDNTLLSSEFDYSPIINSDISLVSVVTNSLSCVRNDTIKINRYNLPVFTIGSARSVCYQDSVVLKSDVSFPKLRWYVATKEMKANSDSVVATIVANERFYAEATDVNGCVNIDSVDIAMLTLPSVSLGVDTSYCYGDSVILNLTGHSSYLWRTTGTVFSDTLLPTFKQLMLTTDTVVVRVTDVNNCINRDTLVAKNVSLPIFSIGADTVICRRDGFQFSVDTSFNHVNWKSSKHGGLIDKYIFSGSVKETDTLIVEVETNFGCKNSDTLKMDMNILPEFELGDRRGVCFKSNLQQRVDVENRSIAWKLSSDTLLYNDTLLFSHVIERDDTLIVNVENINNCRYSDTLYVEMLKLPVVDCGHDTMICYGEPATLGSSKMADFGVEWSHGPTSKTIEESPLVETEYFLKVTDTLGCVNRDSVKVFVNPATVIDLDSELNVCDKSLIELGGQPLATGSLSSYGYNWFPDRNITDATLANAELLVDTSMVFGVEVSTFNCKPDTAYIHIKKWNLPVIETDDTVLVGSGHPKHLQSSGGVDYAWSPDDFLNFTNVPDPIVTPDFTKLYKLQVTDANGCVSEQGVLIKTQNVIFIPTLFTPNGDNVNDKFLVYSSGIEELSITIYNTLGNVVFENSDVSDILTNGWDGTSSGDEAQVGIYYWKIDGFFKNGERVRFNGKSSGLINLIR